MIRETVVVKNPSGLHMRPAGIFAKVANTCKSSVKIIYEGKEIEAKSVLNIMAAAIKSGSTIELICNGDSEKEDMETLLKAINDGLGE